MFLKNRVRYNEFVPSLMLNLFPSFHVFPVDVVTLRSKLCGSTASGAGFLVLLTAEDESVRLSLCDWGHCMVQIEFGTN